jgi:hypothetical protein
MEIYRQWALPEKSRGQAPAGTAPPDPAGFGPEASHFLVILPPGELPGTELLHRLSAWSVFYSASPIDHQSVWLEVFPAGVNKGSSLEAWCREKQIPRNRVLAIGNDFNDESMLTWAGRGYVVQGAPSEMKSRYPVLPPAGDGGFPAAVREALRFFRPPRINQGSDEPEVI